MADEVQTFKALITVHKVLQEGHPTVSWPVGSPHVVEDPIRPSKKPMDKLAGWRHARARWDQDLKLREVRTLKI